MRALLDISAVIDFTEIDEAIPPDELAISAITLAELAAGPNATDDIDERAHRQDRLQWAEVTFDQLPFDTSCARAFGHVHATVAASGRSARCRVVDLLIASVAIANELPLATRNPTDFAALDGLLDVVAV